MVGIPDNWFTRILLLFLVALGLVAWVAFNQLVKMGAGGLLHPARTVARQAMPDGCEDASFRGVDVTLKGWRCRASGTLMLVAGAGHNQSLSRDSTWKEIEAWITGL